MSSVRHQQEQQEDQGAHSEAVVTAAAATTRAGDDDDDDEVVSERLKLSKASERAKKFWNESFSKKTDRGFINRTHMENHPDDTTYHIPRRVLEREARHEKQPAINTNISKGEQSLTRDWLTSYESFKDILHKLAPPESKPSILVIGNGLSYLPIELYKDGYHNVWGTDVNKQANKQMSIIKAAFFVFIVFGMCCTDLRCCCGQNARGESGCVP